MADVVETEEERVRRLRQEGLISLSQAANPCGTSREGKRVHPSTVARWAKNGYTLPSGRVVRLESLHWCGRLMTTAAALDRFVAAQQGQGPAAGVAPDGEAQTPAQLDRAARAASAELDRALGAPAAKGRKLKGTGGQELR